MTVSLNGTSGIVFNDASTQNTSAFTGGFAFRNRLINSDMRIDQRNAGASVSTSGSFPVDRFAVGSTGSVTFTAQRSTTAPAGFINSVLWTTGTGAAPTSTQQSNISQGVEGLNVSDFGWGTASAVTVTLSFWVRSSLTGTFCVAITNNSRSYPATYTISAANTWEQKTITIAGDTSGTWVTTNERAFRVVFDYGTGSNRLGTANIWQSGEYISVSGATQVCATSGATFYITGVQLEKGSTATSFDYRPYSTELQLAQRYYWKITAQTIGDQLGVGLNTTTTTGTYFLSFPVAMRTNPTALEQTGTAGDYRIYHNVVTTCSSVPTFSSASTYATRTTFTVASGLTTGQASFPQAQSTNAYLAWSAEL